MRGRCRCGTRSVQCVVTSPPYWACAITGQPDGPTPRAHAAPASATTLLALDFGDQELVVAEYPDGVVIVRIDDGTVLRMRRRDVR